MIFNDSPIANIDYTALKSQIGFMGLDINFNKDGKVEEEICFNPGNLLNLLSRLLYGFSGEITSEILDVAHGFPQTDGTYALYKNTYLDLQKATSTPWEELTDEQQVRYAQSAKIFLWAIIDKFIEGNR